MSFKRDTLLALTFFALLCAPPKVHASCQDLPSSKQLRTDAQRPIEIDDLVRIRDIGASTVANRGAKTFTISPDKKRIAFQIRRADPHTNSYCLTMAVLQIGRESLVKIVDEGADLIRWNFEFRGKVAFPSGVPITITPIWSPDSLWIFFLKRYDARVQVWRARADGSGGEQVTHSPVDIEDFRVTHDGRSIIFATRPELDADDRAIDREAYRGYRYDDRFSPMTTSRPFPERGNVLRYSAQNLHTGIVRPADEEGQRVFASFRRELVSEEAVAPDQTGRKAWIVPPADDQFFWNSRLIAQDLFGKAVECAATVCKSWVSKPWWSVDGKSIRFFRREGWAHSVTAIYEWNIDQNSPRRIYLTSDLLFECDPFRDNLICLRESSVQPRRLVEIDLSKSNMTTLFDPNPEFSQITFGHVERLHWVNQFGLESYADLVYPTGYRPGQRYPLIIVQYDTRGFLRGGTGDEYPIQAFANRGFMVLSLQRPRDIGYFRAKGESGVDAANLEDFADRRSVQSSLDTGLSLLASRGLIDEKRLGISGLSDGSATVQFALIHNPIFAAAAMSNCCFEPSALFLVGPKASRHFREVGYPTTMMDHREFWDQFSIARNATKIETPILIQDSDDEYLTGLEAYSALTDAGKPVDMFVYPGEHHIKWQPAHRRAIYLRNIWWFDYWLRDVRPISPEGSAEVSVWDALRQRRLSARREPAVSATASQ
jgi:dipeptidyl aminopeptidase/acylaminoacyl peptidase